MKELSKKYDVPEEKLKMMMKDGVISCSWGAYDEIYYCYKSERPSAKSNEDAYNIVAAKMNVSRSTVYNIVHTYE